MENRRRLVKRLWLRMIELPWLRRAAAIHYTAEAEREEANAAHAAVADIASFVLPIPVSVPSTSAGKEPFLHLFPRASGKKIILFLSRVAEKKGMEILLRAFAAVGREDPYALLVIAGSGDDAYLASLHQLAEQLGITEQVLWVGHL